LLYLNWPSVLIRVLLPKEMILSNFRGEGVRKYGLLLFIVMACPCICGVWNHASIKGSRSFEGYIYAVHVKGKTNGNEREKL
jgi:hypothetical protein